jgi:hypothetical protein
MTPYTRAAEPSLQSSKTNDKLKCHIFEKGLRSDTKFKEKLGIKEPRNMHDMLSCAQSYIKYEEKMLGDKTLPKKDERASEDRELRGPKGGYFEYAPLNKCKVRQYRHPSSKSDKGKP